MSLSALEQQYGLPPGILDAVMQAESGGLQNPNAAVSPKGAKGAFQFMPATAQQYGIDPTNPDQAASGAARMLSDLLTKYKGDVPSALAAYNWGQGNLDRLGMDKAPTETRNYIQKVTSRMGSIDPSKVQWDDSSAPAIDPSKVQWDQPQSAPMWQGLAGDVAMGGRQVIDAGAQMLTRGLEAAANKIAPGSAFANWMQGQRQNVEDINKNALADYTARFSPDQRPVAGALARGLGQAAVVGPLVAVGAPATGLVGSLAQGALGGAAGGAMTPVYQTNNRPQNLSDLVTGGGANDFWQQKLAQAGEGAAFGSVMGGIGNALGRVLAPNSSAAVGALTGEGISPTIGQTLGGFWKTLEDKLTSVPLVGDAIKSGQSRGLDQFNQAIYNRILAPIGLTYDGPVGQPALAAVRAKLSDAYESTLGKMVPSPLTGTFNDGIDNIRSMLSARPNALKAFDDAMNAEVWSRFTPENTLTPSQLKAADSGLGGVARDYFNRGDADQLAAARAISEAQSGLRQMAAEANPQQAPVLRAVDSGYAQLVQLQNAAKSVKVARNEGVVTPADYLRGIKSGDTSARDNVFSSGQALNQDFAQAADKVLSSKYPDSGSVGRGLAAALLGGAFAPKALLAGAAASIPYMPYAQGAMSALLSQRPALMGLLGSGVKASAPYLGAGVPVGLLSSQ